MREILFRGKRTDNGEWVEGYYLNQRESLTDKKACYIAANNGYGFNYISVIPETVGQYTGLHDKNGRKIFEGDILIYFGEKNLVEWDDSEATFFLSNEDNERCYFDDVDVNLMFIIGNIYDNPELGGVKQNERI